MSGHLSGTWRGAGAVSSFADIMILLLLGARATPHPGHKTQVPPVVSAPCGTTRGVSSRISQSVTSWTAAGGLAGDRDEKVAESSSEVSPLRVWPEGASRRQKPALGARLQPLSAPAEIAAAASTHGERAGGASEARPKLQKEVRCKRASRWA